MSDTFLPDRFRQRMPVTERWAYFDHAAIGPLSGPAAEQLREWTADLTDNGDANWFRWRSEVETTRERFANLINTSADEIAMVRNTTEGIGLIAEGIDWRDGDNLVTLASEFPSNLYPWQNLSGRGVETRMVKSADSERVDWERLAAACDDRTRLLAISWVDYATGDRVDLHRLSEFTRSRGLLLFVDAIQGLGMHPLDVRETAIDFLAADGHKWLLGPEGAGGLFIRADRLETLRPIGIGWNSVAHAGDFGNKSLTLKPTAARYEGGSYNMAGIAALGASLELLAEFGSTAIESRMFALTTELCERLKRVGFELLSNRDEGHTSAIVSGTLPGTSARTVKKAAESFGVMLSARSGKLRIAPHAYTDESDVAKLIDMLGSV